MSKVSRYRVTLLALPINRSSVIELSLISSDGTGWRAGGGIRTHDLTITNRLRYQTAPHRLGSTKVSEDRVV